MRAKCTLHHVRRLFGIQMYVRLIVASTFIMVTQYAFFSPVQIYGIDMPSSQELVAFNRTTEEVAEEIGADRLIYQNLPDLIESCRKFNPSITEFDVSVFDGQYITKDVDANYFAELERQRHNRTGGVADNGMSTCASSIENGPESPTISTVPLNAMKQFGEEFGSNSTCDSPVAASPARPDAETMGLHNNFSGHTSNN